MRDRSTGRKMGALLGLALALFVVLGLVPGMARVALATDWQDWPANGVPSTAGYYKVEGPINLDSGNWQVPAGTTTLWLTDTGKINLGDNWINVSEGATLEIVSESTGTIESNSMFGTAISVGNGGTLKMHGGKIKGQGSQFAGVVSIPAGAFTMTGGTIETTAESGFAVDNSSDFTMTAGTIKATGTSGRAVNNSGTFIMTGGEIQVAENGVAVQNTKNFDMSGGTINATKDGAKGVVNNGSNSTLNLSGDAKINASYLGVENGDTNGGNFDGGTVTMSGGQIIGQREEVSKGVSSFKGTFTMTGGEISNFEKGVSINGTNFTMDKTGSDSSGTISGNNIGVNVDGTFYMNAGKIQNNTVDGVSYSSGTFNMSGGSITSNGKYGLTRYALNKITLSGQVDISGNTEADIYFPLNQSSTGDLKIENGFGCDKPISVSGNATGLQNHVFTEGFSKTGSSDPSKYFKSGATGYGLYLKDNEVAFGAAATVTFDPNGGAGTMEPQALVKGVETQLNANAFARQGYSFNGWNTKADGTGDGYADGEKVTLSEDVTLYATWKAAESQPGPGPEPEPAPAEVPPVSVTAHVQKKGNLPAVSGGAIAGTTGKSLRLESLKLTVPGASATGGIEYRSHVQGKGWEKSYARDGELSGTEGKAKRLEAVKIRLWGDMRDKYDVWYRVHSQRYGWMAWAKNGERAGTQGMSRRAEAIQVVLVRKDAPAPDATYKGVTQQYAKAFVKK